MSWVSHSSLWFLQGIEENVEVVHEVSLDFQADSNTWSRVLRITGTIWDACNNALKISVYVLHAVHTFHDEAWDLFTFVGGGSDFVVIHCNGGWQPQIDPDMLHFRLQLVNRYGTRLRLARPFNQDDFYVRAHEQAALVFTVEKKQMFILCAIVGCGSLKSGVTKYWRFTDAVGNDQDAADGGIPLTDAGRWRSHATLAYLAHEGLGTVPADIQDELADLVENLPRKRDDESQRSNSTWRRKWQVAAPESEPPAQKRPGYPHPQSSLATSSSSVPKPPPPPPPPAPKRSTPTTGEWLGLDNQQVGQRSSNWRSALMAQMSNCYPVTTNATSKDDSTLTQDTTQSATPFLQPMTISVSQEGQAVPLMAVSAPAGHTPITPPPPAKPVVAASHFVASRPAAPSTPSDPASRDDTMNATPGEGSGELKRPHDTASPGNDTPSKKTFSDTPATPASDSSAVRTERARLTALAEENQIKAADATKRQAEVVKTMQETLQELQALRLEEEDIRRKLDALKGEESVYSATVSADSSHKWPRSYCFPLCGTRNCWPLCFSAVMSVRSFWDELCLITWWFCHCSCCVILFDFVFWWLFSVCLFADIHHVCHLWGCALTRLAQVYHSFAQVLHLQGCITLPTPCLRYSSSSFVLAPLVCFSVILWVEALC